MKNLLVLCLWCASFAPVASAARLDAEALIKLTKMNDQFGNCYEGTSNDFDGDIWFDITDAGAPVTPLTVNLSAESVTAKVIMNAVMSAGAESNLTLSIVVLVGDRRISATELGMTHAQATTRLPDVTHTAFSLDDACPDRVDIVMKRVHAGP